MPRTQNLSDLDVIKPKITKRTSVYSDLSLAFLPHPNTGDVTVLQDINAVKQSVRNLILTSPGERPFNPNIGSGVRALLFEPVDAFTAIDLKEAITLTIENFEPRIKLNEVKVFDEADNNRYRIEIEFIILTSLQTGDVDFYIERLR
jgi:phage baseplate assembly protein W